MRTTISIAVGIIIALVCMAASFAGLSLARPGWLRELANPNATPVSVATLIAIVDSGGQVPAVTPLPTDPSSPPPTVAPLPTVPGACGGPHDMTIALLGMDTRGEEASFRARTDAITLLNINFATKTASMLSVPRDLYV